MLKENRTAKVQAQAGTDRKTVMYVLLGYNGTGKTTFCDKIIRQVAQSKGRVLIVTPDDYEWQQYPLVEPAQFARFGGVARTIFDDTTLDALIGDPSNKQSGYFSGWLIFDDCRSYLTSSTSKALHRLFIRRRQKDINIIAVGHGFTEVPPKFFTFASHIILFKTIDNVAKRKAELGKAYEYMTQQQTAVNRAARVRSHYFKIIDLLDVKSS